MKRLVSLVGGSYGVIAFAIGFALMAYELVASRLLAPTIGSSTYVWTSVIGVIIAALAIGYAVGGWLADKRVAKFDIAWLLLASALAATSTLMFYDGLLFELSRLGIDDRLRALLAALVLFMPASFGLGMISPYLARLRNESLDTTGRSVASLSALNAVGGIVGTFSVGFIFFGYIGSRETLVVIIALLVATSWLVSPKVRLVARVVGSLAILAAAGLALVVPGPHTNAITIDTPTAHYQVAERIYDNQAVTMLLTGPYIAQSGVFSDGSPDLVFRYTKLMANMVQLAPQRQNILILGGGAFTLPRYLAETHPDSHIDVVEIDPQLPDIAKQYFDYKDQPNVTIISQDARAFLQHNQKTYDIILVDVYGEMSIPFSVTTVEYAAQLKQAVKPGGVVIANIIGANNQACAPLLGSIHTSYLPQFKGYSAFALGDRELQELQNVVVAYSDSELPWLKPFKPLTTPLPTGMQLTDNLAPLERLSQTCRRA